MSIDPNYFYCFIDVGGAHIANRAGHVEHELPDADRAGQSFGRDKDFAGKQALQEVPTEVTLGHAVNGAKNRLAFGLSGLQHDKCNAPSVWPVAALSKKDGAQFLEGNVVDRVGLIHDDCEVLLSGLRFES